VKAWWFSSALEEYKVLRVEVVDASQAQRTTMQLGLTALSVLVGLGLRRHSAAARGRRPWAARAATDDFDHWSGGW